MVTLIRSKSPISFYLSGSKLAELYSLNNPPIVFEEKASIYSKDNPNVDFDDTNIIETESKIFSKSNKALNVSFISDSGKIPFEVENSNVRVVTTDTDTRLQQDVKISSIQDKSSLSKVYHYSEVKIFVLPTFENSGSTLVGGAIISVLDRERQIPEYKVIKTDECDIDFSSISGVEEIIIEMPLGKMVDIVSIPDDDEIVGVKYRPFGILFDSNKVWGRLLTNKDYLPIIILTKKGRVLKVKLQPKITKIFTV